MILTFLTFSFKFLLTIAVIHTEDLSHRPFVYLELSNELDIDVYDIRSQTAVEEFVDITNKFIQNPSSCRDDLSEISKYIILVKTNKPCLFLEGNLYKIGIPLQGRFLTLIHVCRNASYTIYTSHYIHGKYLQDDCEVHYLKQTRKPFMKKSGYLGYTELTPSKDMLAPWKKAVDFEENRAPIWKARISDWTSLVETLNKFAQRTQSKLKIITGRSGRTVGNHNLTKATSRLLPHFIWKIVYDIEEKRATVFVLINKMDRIRFKKDLICIDLCEQYGWRKEVTTNYIYCCNYLHFPYIDKLSRLPYIDVLEYR